MHTDEWKRNWNRPKPEHNIPTPWNWVAAYPKLLIIGDYVDIGAFTYLQAEYGIILEDYVNIGGGCHIYSVNTIDDTKGLVRLEEGSKIGAHSVILPGVVVGENSKVGAFSLVKEDIPDGVIAAGQPAKVIKKII